jgi:sec-independent protein translocase protein TatA
MRNFGMSELLIILLVILVLFGAKKLPDLARALGRSLNEFKKGREEGAKPGDSDEKKTDEKKS